MEEQTPLQNPEKPQRWSNYFKEFLMIFLQVGMLCPLANGQSDYSPAPIPESIQVIENKEKHTYTITRGKKPFGGK